MTSFWIKVAISTVLIVGMAGVAISHDLSKQRAIEAKHRQQAFCHQYYDHQMREYLITRNEKFMRRLTVLVEDTIPCKEFFEERLKNGD